MSLLERTRRALVVAPHPDDEVLGCGGTIARLADTGREAHVVIVTRGRPPRYDSESVEVLCDEARKAHAVLGVAGSHWLDFPAAELDRAAHADLNEALATLMAELEPDALFIPFVGDIHLDHQMIFHSSMVAARPRDGAFPARVYAYETLSETEWSAPYLTAGFQPNVFVDITEYREAKLRAFAHYHSQVRESPGARSLEALNALATLRGSTVNRPAAEAFVLLRELG